MNDWSAVQEAVVARDHVASLRALLEAWRANRAPELAEAVEHVSRALEPTVAPLGATGPKKAYEAWLARAAKADPVDLVMLLRDLFDGPPAYIRARLQALEVHGDDPRIATVLCEYLVESGDWLPGTPVGTAIFKLLGRHGDARVLPALAGFADPARAELEWRTKKLDALAKTIGKYRVTPLGKEALETLARVRTIDAGPTRGEASFVAAKDVPARAVATDSLLEEGGPRGEFIVLQQTRRLRPLTAAEKKREEALLAAHRKKWMGGVAKILDPAKSVFEDGVLVGGEVECGMDDLQKVIDAPEWSSVRFVDFGGWTPDAALFRRWPTITRATVTSARHFVDLANADPPLALTGLVYAGPDQHPTEVERDALTVARGLPALTHLSISGYWHEPSALAWILEGELARRLTRLSYTRRLSIVGFLELLARAPQNLEVGTMGYDDRGARIDFTRDETARFSRAVVGFTPPKEDVRKQFDKMLAALDAVPNGLLTHVEIDSKLEAPTKAHRARLDEIAARHTARARAPHG